MYRRQAALTLTMKVRVPFSFWGMTMLCTEKTKRASFDTPKEYQSITFEDLSSKLRNTWYWLKVSYEINNENTLAAVSDHEIDRSQIKCLVPGGSWNGTTSPSWGPAPSGRCSLELSESSTLNSMDFKKLLLLFSKMTDTTTKLSSCKFPWISYTCRESTKYFKYQHECRMQRNYTVNKIF